MMRAARLRRSRDIAKVRSEGRAMRRAGFVARALSNEHSTTRVAVVASGAIGGAVVRNRARRRVREAFRHALREDGRTAAVDVLVTVRREATLADFRTLQADAADVLREAAR